MAIGLALKTGGAPNPANLEERGRGVTHLRTALACGSSVPPPLLLLTCREQVAWGHRQEADRGQRVSDGGEVQETSPQ